MPTSLRPESEQIEDLKSLGKELWEQHRVTSAVIIRLGDVPMLSTYGRSEVCAVDGFDVWRDGDLRRPDVTRAEAINVLHASAQNRGDDG